jgi:hypothetical protein
MRVNLTQNWTLGSRSSCVSRRSHAKTDVNWTSSLSTLGQLRDNWPYPVLIVNSGTCNKYGVRGQSHRFGFERSEMAAGMIEDALRAYGKRRFHLRTPKVKDYNTQTCKQLHFRLTRMAYGGNRNKHGYIRRSVRRQSVATKSPHLHFVAFPLHLRGRYKQRRNFTQDELKSYMKINDIHSVRQLMAKRKPDEPTPYDYRKAFGSWQKAVIACYGEPIKDIFTVKRPTHQYLVDCAVQMNNLVR